MRFSVVFSVLFCCSLLAIFGCSDSIEESEANLLSSSEEIRFQGLPVLEGGSLIPPEEVPVITIEKTREDADNVWFRLRADPAPEREDLVVQVNRWFRLSADPDLNPEDTQWVWVRDGIELYEALTHVSFYTFLNQNWEAIRERDEDLLPPDFGELEDHEKREIRRNLDHYIHDHIWRTKLVAIPRFQNNSVEIKIGGAIKDTSVIVEPFSFWVRREGAFAGPGPYLHIDVPVTAAFEISNGYVVPAGFEFHYYLVGEEDTIEMPRIEGDWWQILFPDEE